MILRTLVTNWIRQQAQEQLVNAARQSMAGEAGQNSEPAAPRPPCEIAVVFATEVEAGGLIDLLGERLTTRCASFLEHTGFVHSLPIAVVETGIGSKASAQAVRDAIALHPLRCVISAGFAGGLVKDLRRGHILMADEIVDLHGHHVSVDLHVDKSSLVNNPALHVGRLLTVDHLVRRSEEKRRLGDHHAALAFDMESMAVADVCQQHQVKFLSVRLVSDSVDDELSKDLQWMLDQKSLAAKIGAAAGALLNRPSNAKAMWQLKEDAIKASDRLGRFLAGVLDNLPITRT
jgi:adenosylhomocysteine nucleosidase